MQARNLFFSHSDHLCTGILSDFGALKRASAQDSNPTRGVENPLLSSRFLILMEKPKITSVRSTTETA
jgi:hypothetical protein